MLALFEEEFSSGFFDLGEIGSKADWFLYRQQEFVARDPQTRIAFLKNRLSITIPEYSLSAVGQNDHFKFLFFTNTVNEETGFPGFAVPEAGSLSCEITARVHTFQTGENPFECPENDFRLSCGALISVDFANFIIYGFLVTGDSAFAIYERWPSGEGSAKRPGFSYIVPVKEITPGTDHTYRMDYSRERSELTWSVDGEKVHKFAKFGEPMTEMDEEGVFMEGVHEENAEAVEPSDQRLFGAGLMTFLDAKGAENEPLVNIHDLNVTKDKKIFGQGGEIILGHFRVFTG